MNGKTMRFIMTSVTPSFILYSHFRVFKFSLMYPLLNFYCSSGTNSIMSLFCSAKVPTSHDQCTGTARVAGHVTRISTSIRTLLLTLSIGKGYQALSLKPLSARKCCSTDYQKRQLHRRENWSYGVVTTITLNDQFICDD